MGNIKSLDFFEDSMCYTCIDRKDPRKKRSYFYANFLKGGVHVIPFWNIVSKASMEEEKKEVIINDNVDKLLTEMEGYFKEAVEAHKPLQDDLNEAVKYLMDEFDAKKETIRYEQIKSFADFIALAMSMPLPEELKEDIIKTLVEKAREKEE